MQKEDPGPVTQLLRQLALGTEDVMPQLVDLVYSELRAIAYARMRQERSGHTLTPTALVHEAYVRLSKSDGLQCENRSHFLAVAAQAMRRILVDHARAKKAARRGGDGERVQIRDFNLAAPASDDQVLALDAALEKLAELSPRQCRVVELRYFAGLTEEQVAEVLGVTRRTVCRDWLVARTWLQTQIGVRDRA
jgi:RNA polymerase sigma factor (TIGR02999 family)